MKYYIDTEFLEGTQKEKFPISLFRKTTPPTIDLISIGIVAEDGRELYLISKDFNLKEAWNRFDWKEHKSTHKEDQGKKLVQKVYWIRENVLKPIYYEWYNKDINFHEVNHFTYKNFKKLLSKYGKTNKEIADEIRIFTDPKLFLHNNAEPELEFYAYYADYDWVVFAWLWGKMINLPESFPMYCKDLKQDFDFFNENFKKRKELNAVGNLHKSINELKDFRDYPKQEYEHSAIYDARWNKKLHEFLNKL